MPIEEGILLDDRQATMDGLVADLRTSETRQNQILDEVQGINKETSAQVKELLAEYNQAPDKTTFEKLQPLLASAAYILDTRSGNRQVRNDAGKKLARYRQGRVDAAKAVDDKRRQTLLDKVTQVNLQTQSALKTKQLDLEKEKLRSSTSLTESSIRSRNEPTAADKFRERQEEELKTATTKYDEVIQGGGSWVDLDTGTKVSLLRAGFKPEQTALDRFQEVKIDLWDRAFKAHQKQWNEAFTQEQRAEVMNSVDLLFEKMLSNTIPPQSGSPDGGFNPADFAPAVEAGVGAAPSQVPQAGIPATGRNPNLIQPQTDPFLERMVARGTSILNNQNQPQNSEFIQSVISDLKR